MKNADLSSRRKFLETAIKATTIGIIAPHLDVSNAAPSPSQSRWRIGCYTRPWDKYDYRMALDAIAEAGFKYVGLMTTQSDSKLVISAKTTPEEVLQVRDEVKKRKLEVLSVWAGNFNVKDSMEQGLDDLKRMIENSSLCGSKSLLIGGIGDDALVERYYQVVAKCCDFAKEKGIELALKPHGGTNATGPQCRKIIEQVNHPNFRLWYDPGNIFYYSNGELDPVQDSVTVSGIVTGMCVKDYLHPKNVAVTPATGQVDFKQVFSNLAKGGFSSGPLVIEVLTPGSETELVAHAVQAREFLQRILNK